jgi:hypothetical protein
MHAWRVPTAPVHKPNSAACAARHAGCSAARRWLSPPRAALNDSNGSPDQQQQQKQQQQQQQQQQQRAQAGPRAASPAAGSGSLDLPFETALGFSQQQPEPRKPAVKGVVRKL